MKKTSFSTWPIRDARDTHGAAHASIGSAQILDRTPRAAPWNV
jgi:hypothetical protein